MESTLLWIALPLYGLSLGLLLGQRFRWSNMLLSAAAIMHLIALIARSYVAHHPPFTNLYETLILLPFLMTLRLLFWKRQFREDVRAVMTGILMIIILIALLLPQSLRAPKPLMPALNSIWMYIHVPAYFFGYMALVVAGIYAVMILGRSNVSDSTNTLIQKMDSEVKIAFFFLNVGLITGGIWAYISWGNYWGWDPKETWALINILVLAFYFHLRYPTKRKKAIVILIALLSVAFTYWGVSFILSGLHSYT